LKKSKLKRIIKILLAKQQEYSIEVNSTLNSAKNIINNQQEEIRNLQHRIELNEEDTTDRTMEEEANARAEKKSEQKASKDELDEAKHYALEALQDALDDYEQTTGESITINLEESN